MVQQRLRQLVADFRTEQGISRSKLAKRAGMTLWMVSMFERGDRQLSMEGALRLCHAMDVKLWKVLKEVEE